MKYQWFIITEETELLFAVANLSPSSDRKAKTVELTILSPKR